MITDIRLFCEKHYTYGQMTAHINFLSSCSMAVWLVFFPIDEKEYTNALNTQRSLHETTCDDHALDKPCNPVCLQTYLMLILSHISVIILTNNFTTRCSTEHEVCYWNCIHVVIQQRNEKLISCVSENQRRFFYQLSPQVAIRIPLWYWYCTNEN